MVKKKVFFVVIVIVASGLLVSCGGGDEKASGLEESELSRSFQVVESRMSGGMLIIPVVPTFILQGNDAIPGKFSIVSTADQLSTDCVYWTDWNPQNGVKRLIIRPAYYANKLVAGQTYQLVRDGLPVGPELQADPKGLVGPELMDCVGHGVYHFPLPGMEISTRRWSGDILVAFPRTTTQSPTLKVEGPVAIEGGGWTYNRSVGVVSQLSIYRRRVVNVVEGQYRATFNAGRKDPWSWYVGSMTTGPGQCFVTKSDGSLVEFGPEAGTRIPVNGLIILKDPGGYIQNYPETSGSGSVVFRETDVDLGPGQTLVYQPVSELNYHDCRAEDLGPGQVYRFYRYGFEGVDFRVEVENTRIQTWIDKVLFEAGLAPSAPFYGSVRVPVDATLLVKKGVFAGEASLELQKNFEKVDAAIVDKGSYYQIRPTEKLEPDQSYALVTRSPSEMVAPFRTLP